MPEMQWGDLKVHSVEDRVWQKFVVRRDLRLVVQLLMACDSYSCYKVKVVCWSRGFLGCIHYSFISQICVPTGTWKWRVTFGGSETMAWGGLEFWNLDFLSLLKFDPG